MKNNKIFFKVIPILNNHKVLINKINILIFKLTNRNLFKKLQGFYFIFY